MNRQTGVLSPQAYLAFFQTGAIPESIPAPVPSATNGLGVVEYEPDPEVPGYRHQHGQDYAEEYRQAEQQTLLRASLEPADEASSVFGGTVRSVTARMSQLEVDTYADPLSELGERPDYGLTDVYQSYDFAKTESTTFRLPIHTRREEIVSKVDAFEVVVLMGHTGCGKTTQVPQYLLDEARRLDRPANIIVTQPRRIAAVSVARRVAKERNWPLGTLVGYEIGLDKKTGPDTRITYCTTGVLLQKLVHEGNMNRYTHVVLDEVHERDTDTDFALLLVRKLLRTTSRNVKVILMSATFNTHLFAEYFSVPVAGRLDPAPVINCGEEKMFDVRVHYLEELAELMRALPGAQDTYMERSHSSAPQINPRLYTMVVELVKRMNRFDVAEFGPSVRYQRFGAQRGSVLVFLPGMHEIQEMVTEMESHRLPERWHILPLHSMITSDEQNAVFQPVAPDERKIILSTNMAESSITVTDVKYVIDFCLTKELEMDPETGYPKLRLAWASKANCLQRQGRAGRVSAGRVYRLVNKQFYMGLPDYGVPEMLRSPLEHVVIKAKRFCSDSEPKAVLALALQPPDLEKIYAAVLHLKEVGALIDVAGAQRFNMYDGELTVLGHVMSTLPVDVNVARLLALGHAYGCLRECLVIAAGLTAKTFFARPFNDELRAYQSKMAWSNNTFSDCLAILHAYEVWQDHVRQGHFQRSGGRGERDWADKQFLQLRCLKDMDALRRELERRLETCNIRPVGVRRAHQQTSEERRQQALILQVCLAGAFYPNFFLRQYREDRELDANRELACRNPQTTVVVAGLPRDTSALYYGQLVRQLRFNPTDPDPVIQFENSKAYVEFAARRREGGGPGAFVGDIPVGVYLAVRMGQIRNKRLSIMRYSPEDEQHKMELFQRLQERCGVRGHITRSRPTTLERTATTESARIPDTCRLPGVGINAIAVVVTHVEDPGRFFVRYTDATGEDEFERVHGLIRALGPGCAPLGQPPEVGRLYLAPYKEQGVTSHYRARVDVSHQHDCLVYFIDFGNTVRVASAELLVFSPELLAAGVLETQALAAECCCSELKPTRAMGGRWDQQATDRFREMVLYQPARGNVYSVLHGVIHLELFQMVREGHATRSVSVNVRLQGEGLAEFAREGLLSRKDRDQRLEDYSRFRSGGDTGDANWDRRQLSSDPELTGWLKRQELGSRREQLRGPDSPLLLSLMGLPRSLQSRPVTIDSDSCNAVLLDTEPDNPFDRLLVAAQVAPSSDGSRLRVLGTSLMPNLPGLPSLLTLLFAPVVELRADLRRGVITGALGGLGGAPHTHHPIFPDHDMEVSFDVSVTTKDLTDVNLLRASFWLLFGGVDAEAAVEPQRLRESDRTAAEQQQRRRARLLGLLERRREPMTLEERVLCRYPYRWGRMPEEEKLQVRYDSEHDPRLAPLLVTGVRAVKRVESAALRLRAEALFAAAWNSEEPNPHFCEFCEVTLPNPRRLLQHVSSEEHRQLVLRVFQEDDEEDDDVEEE